MAQELTTINVSLPVQMRAYIEQRVKADGFGSISDLIRALVRDDQVRRRNKSLKGGSSRRSRAARRRR